MIKKKRKFVAITTLIDKGIVISGDTTYTGGIRIDGKIKGNLKVHGKEDSLLIMGDGSKIVGDVEVEKAIINGEINGNVKCHDYLELNTPNLITSSDKDNWNKAASWAIFNLQTYNNIDKKDYPAMLITTSLFDNRVLYSEPVKYIAKLRETKTDSNTQLLKCKMEAAGHGGMSGRDNAIKELAEEYSFILKTAKILK